MSPVAYTLVFLLLLPLLSGKVLPLIRWVDDAHALFVCPDVTSGVDEVWEWCGQVLTGCGWAVSRV